MIPTGIIQPTDDMEASATFFRDVMGLKVKFRDGDRYCAFEMGAMTFALVSGEEKIMDQTAMVFRVVDVPAALVQLTAKGARVVRPAETGPHEVRAVLTAPGGGGIVLSAKIK